MAKVKNVLIFGGNGLVGKSFEKILNNKNDYKVFSTSRVPKDNQLACDITDSESIKNCFRIIKPSLVINCTNLAGGVNFCEDNPTLSESFHFEANKTMSKLSDESDIPFVLISTDYVFDGTKGPYSEDDEKNPMNEYGHHKLKAENWIKKNTSKYIIARTTNVFGWDPLTKTPNYLMQLFFNLSAGKICNAPSFLSGNPTYVDDLSQAILDLLSQGNFGIYHVVGSSNINRYEWATKFCDLLDLDKKLLNQITKAPDGIVPRPFVSNLNTDKLENALGYKLSNLDEGLVKFKQEMKAK
jgi:dTDP-4-dehydrorhamnose reductase